MFTIEYDKVLNRITMKNCGPYTSKHPQYGNRAYRNISKSSFKRLIRWMHGDGHLISTTGIKANGDGWWKVKR